MTTNEWTSDCGTVRLICGDCRLLVPTILELDAVVTSPPYNCGKEYGTDSDDLPLEEFEVFLTETIFSVKSRVWIVNVGQFIGSRKNRVLFRDVLLSACGWIPLIDEVVWDKGPANGSAWGNYPNSPRVRAQHESIFVFGSATMPNGNGLDWAEWARLTTSIWRVLPPAAVDLSIHPAMMPVEIAWRCVSLWTDINGTILDPFMGSGTTGVACVRTGRKFIGIEREPKYFEIAKRRISDELNRFPLLKSQPQPVQQTLLEGGAQ